MIIDATLVKTAVTTFPGYHIELCRPPGGALPVTA
jgi:hypothetical protein